MCNLVTAIWGRHLTLSNSWNDMHILNPNIYTCSTDCPVLTQSMKTAELTRFHRSPYWVPHRLRHSRNKATAVCITISISWKMLTPTGVTQSLPDFTMFHSRRFHAVLEHKVLYHWLVPTRTRRGSGAYWHHRGGSAVLPTKQDFRPDHNESPHTVPKRVCVAYHSLPNKLISG
jgi:hypothetical protein